MSERRKPNSHAVLMNLPEERQEQIGEWCAKPNDRDADGKAIPETGGLAFARAQLAADGLKVSLDTLSRFYKWWQLEQDIALSFEREDQVLAKTGDAKKAREAGEVLLARLGLASQDAELIATAAKISDSRRSLDLQEESGKTKAAQKAAQIKQKDAELQLGDRRVKLLEENQRAAKEKLTAVITASKGGLTPETLKQIEEAAGLL